MNLFSRSIPEAFDFFHPHAMPNRDVYFILHRRSLISFDWEMFWVVGLHTFRPHSHLPFRFLPQADKKLACINLPLVPTYLPSSEGAYYKNVTKKATLSISISLPVSETLAVVVRTEETSLSNIRHLHLGSTLLIYKIMPILHKLQ